MESKPWDRVGRQTFEFHVHSVANYWDSRLRRESVADVERTEIEKPVRAEIQQAYK